MGHLPLIDELAVIALLGVVVTVVLARLRLPTVAGLLLAGALAGPHGFGLVHSHETIEVLAELGVVLLLYTIGLEFSVSRLKDVLGQVALGGILQVGLTLLAAFAIMKWQGASTPTSIFFGCVVALSSTAIVLRGLTERREMDAPHGRFILGTLIIQDLCVVPMVILVPLLSESADGNLMSELGRAGMRAAVLIVVLLFGARYLVPKLLTFVDNARSREVFLLAILGICFGTAYLTSMAGLSLALGAFLGGMLVADTDFGHRAMSELLPIRDAFVSLFFVSMGMLFDYSFIEREPWIFALSLFGLLFGKGMIASFAALFMRFPVRAAFLAGVGLAQFGEFGFVLAKLGIANNAVDTEQIGPFLNAGIVSMFLTPVLMRLAPHITAGEKLLAPLEKLLRLKTLSDEPAVAKLKDHVVIVGYGIAGRMNAETLSSLGIPYIVLEMNAETVRSARGRDVPIFYADATSEEALSHAHLETAKALVVLANDPQAMERIVVTARAMQPHLPILLRARYIRDREHLLSLGATDVVAEEVEAGAEVLTRILRWTTRDDVETIEARVLDAKLGIAGAQRTMTIPPSLRPENSP